MVNVLSVLMVLHVDAGYWVDRSKFSYGDRVYECPWNTCIGFQKVVNAHDNDDAMVNTLYACW
eukprot:CAMPEP_0114371800 /NCGR_PEP_ID=MMETSP0101-20121206/33687_1 /TAXON_ID=38822 ORGANISM="Pteridomonas danica, Strain PT" /NCGR_SAMPLE_ID=MMETSP0101 /ASSEMBLY_ACC=CAM_ASM_000211 /LENGTH=62 /DNA_ID=CAMNT_0001524321 /DNA_START=211 /DNA_END=396 /DNA_ORIENTATION=-